MNYNFEAPLFGVFSSNRPELSEPYFSVLQQAVELGEWRASLPTWHSGSFGHTAGQDVNSFQGMEQTSPDGRSPVPAGYGKIVIPFRFAVRLANPKSITISGGMELPIHLSPWPTRSYFADDWGQRSAASFAAKPFIDYADYTSNRTFLRDVAYPFCRRAAEFYA